MKKLLSLTLALAIACIIICPISLRTYAVTYYTEGNYQYIIVGQTSQITSVNFYISGDVSIPNKLGGFKVGSIGQEAFAHCSKITSIIIPDTITSIYKGAFLDCENLKSITFGSNVTFIASDIFEECSSLTDIYYSGTIADKNMINIASNNEILLNAKWHFLLCENYDHRYDDNCDEKCNICDKMRTAPHYYEWVVDRENDCGNNGIKHKECIVCNKKESENTQIPATGNHSYNNNCDTICNKCGAVREITHIYNNSCDRDCNICGTSRTPSDHVYNNACDSNCNICGEVRTVPEHEYDDYFDGTCNICGESRDIYTWEIVVDDTGVYNITPNIALDYFNKDSIVIVDKSGATVKYNESKCGWPLVENKRYMLIPNFEVEDYVSLRWNLIKKADTIFPDTSASGWYNDAVTYAVGAGIMGGYNNGKFGTSDSIQRQDFLVMLARLDGVNLDNYKYKSSFPDVARNSYYEAAVNWGAENGIVTGYQNGKFGVGDKVTREQLVTFLYRYAKYKDYDYSYTNNRETVVSGQYKDFKKVSGFAKQPILWAIEKGVISGKTNTTIVPQGNAQRCEVAKIMYNIYLNDIFK